MKQVAKILLIASLGWGALSVADTVVKTQPKRKLLAVTFSSEKAFQPDEEVCLMAHEVSLGCGNILQSSTKGAIIFLHYGGTSIPPGTEVDTVSRKAVPRSRGITIGVNYTFLQVQFQQLFAPKFTYGLMAEGMILRNGQYMKGFAALMTLNYYSGGLMKGFWLMGAAGLHIVNKQVSSNEADPRDSVTSLLTQANIGWRFRGTSFTLGLAVGVQYFIEKSLQPIVGHGGLLPSTMVDIGFIF